MNISGWLAIGILSWLLIALPAVVSLKQVASRKSKAFVKMSLGWVFISAIAFFVLEPYVNFANLFTYMLWVGIPLILGFYGVFPTSKYPNIRTTAIFIMGASFLMLLLAGGFIVGEIAKYINI